jgi:hypothetical protein
MQYESPEILASYSEEELTTVSMQYMEVPTIPA